MPIIVPHLLSHGILDLPFLPKQVLTRSSAFAAAGPAGESLYGSINTPYVKSQ